MSYRGVGSYYEIPQPMGEFYEVGTPRPVGGVGSYYTFKPHEVYAGYGAFGASAIQFSADAVLADIKISDTCYGPGGTGVPTASCNAAGVRVNKAVAAGLNELGYGPIPVDGTTSSWSSAWKKFLADFGLKPGPGFGLSEQGLRTLESQLAQGKKPGPAAAVSYEKVNGEYLPTKKAGAGAALAGMTGGTLLLAALVVGGVGYAAYASGKKKKKGGASAGRMKL